MVGAPLVCLRHLTESTKMSNHITESKERAKLFRSPSWMHNFQLLILYIKLYFLKAFCNFLVNQIHGCRSCSLWLLQYNLPNTTDSIWYTLFANKEKNADIYQQYSKNYLDKTVAYFGCSETMSPSWDHHQTHEPSSSVLGVP